MICILVGGFKHECYFPFHIWDVILQPLTFTPSFFKMVIFCTTNQLSIIIIHHNYGKSPAIQWVNLFGPLEMDDPQLFRGAECRHLQEWDLALDLQLQQFAQRFLVDGPWHLVLACSARAYGIVAVGYWNGVSPASMIAGMWGPYQLW